MKRKVLIIAIIAIVVLLAVAVGVALANAAKPGDALFSIDKAVESLRLAVATRPGDKVELKIGFARERAQELGDIDKTASSSLNLAADELGEAVDDVDKSSRELKAEIAGGAEGSFTFSDLSQILDNLVVALEDAEKIVARVAAEVEGRRVKLKLRLLKEDIGKKADSSGDFEARGKVRGEDGEFKLALEGRSLSLVGEIGFSPFVDKEVKVEGELVGDDLVARELELGQTKVNREGGRVRITLIGKVLERQGDMVVEASGLTFILIGELADPEVLSEVLGGEAELRGVLKGDEINLERVKSEAKDGVDIKKGDVKEEKEPEGAPEEKAGLPKDTATRILEGDEIELRGILAKSGDDFVMTAEGITYTLEGSNLDSFVGKKVEAEGHLDGTVVTLKKIKPED